MGDIWTTFALQIAGFNTLAATTTLVSQTEAGMNQLLSSCISVMKQGVTVGYIGTGLNWSGSIPFGDPVQFANSINAVGYYIYSQPIAQQSQTTRTQRIAPTIQIAFKRAGGIQMANIYGIVQS